MAIRAGVVAVTLLLLCGKSTAVGGVAPADQQEVQVRLEHGGVVRALIDPRHGGELSALSVLIDGRWHELIYRAADYSSSPGWRGKAPLLWPATGVSISEQGEKGRYAVDGKEYEMPMHGFARFSEWKVLQAQTDSDSSVALLELTESELSLEIYPFAFSLQVEYRLDDCGLQLRYRVAASADNERAMPFSIGNHITFRVPLVEASAGTYR